MRNNEFFKNIFFKIIIPVIISFIFFKESVLLNEEAVLITAFFIFGYLTFSNISNMLKVELDKRASVTAQTISNCAYYKKKAIIALTKIFKAYKKLNYIITRFNSRSVYLILLAESKSAVSFEEIENSVIDKHFSSIIYFQNSFVQNVFKNKINKFHKEVWSNIYSQEMAAEAIDSDINNIGPVIK